MRHIRNQKSKRVNLSKLPNWLSEFQNVNKISIDGNNHLNKLKNLEKLNHLFPNLDTLYIDPAFQTTMKANFIPTISKFKNLKLLRIEHHKALNQSCLDSLELALPNCDINYFYSIKNN